VSFYRENRMKQKMLNQDSLALTLWNLEKARLNGDRPERKEIDEALDWIIKRQKDPGRYGLGFAAPTEKDYVSSTLPTGEKLHSKAGTAHLLGEEAFWALSKWRSPQSPGIREGLIGILGRARRFPAQADEGRYCCATCSLAIWRAITASGLKEGEAFVHRGISTMSLIRDGKLGWRGFSFGYTIYSLSSLELPLADKELKYAGGRIERALRRIRPTNDPHGLRKLGYEKALNRIG